MSESKTETVKLIPDHVSGMRLAVMLAARGVNNDGLAGLLAEAERVGRMADAFAALVERLGGCNAHAALTDAADHLEHNVDWSEPVLQLEDALRVAAYTLTKTD